MTSLELIALQDLVMSEFDAITPGELIVAIAVRPGPGGNERMGAVVWNYDDRRKEMLDSLINGGGEPIGLIKISDSGKNLLVDSILLEEYRDDQSARRSLKRICQVVNQRFIELVAKKGKVNKISYFECPSGWLN